MAGHWLRWKNSMTLWLVMMNQKRKAYCQVRPVKHKEKTKQSKNECGDFLAKCLSIPAHSLI